MYSSAMEMERLMSSLFLSSCDVCDGWRILPKHQKKRVSQSVIHSVVSIDLASLSDVDKNHSAGGAVN